MRITKPHLPPLAFPMLFSLGVGIFLLTSCRTNPSPTEPAAKQPIIESHYRSTAPPIVHRKSSAVEPQTVVKEMPIQQPAAGSEIMVNENEANRIITASGEDISITGDNGLILITGKCRNLKISGSNNQVQSDTVSNVRISGNRNSVVAGSLGGGNLSGTGNQLTWEKGINGLKPAIEILGSGNETTELN